MAGLQVALSALSAALSDHRQLDNIAALYKKLGKLQDASVEAALASDELSTGQERRFKKLRNETMDLVKSLKLNNNRIEALIDHARAVVYEKCGVELVAEVKIVGEPRADEVSP